MLCVFNFDINEPADFGTGENMLEAAHKSLLSIKVIFCTVFKAYFSD